jgi:hypothetical protein
VTSLALPARATDTNLIDTAAARRRTLEPRPMDLLLLALGVFFLPGALAVALPSRWIPVRRDRRLAILLQLVGTLAVIGGSAYLLWLMPGAVATAACVVGSGFLMILSLFSIVLPCPRSAGLEVAMILMRSGVAMAVYGTGRRMVLAHHHRRG